MTVAHPLQDMYENNRKVQKPGPPIVKYCTFNNEDGHMRLSHPCPGQPTPTPIMQVVERHVRI